MTKLKASDIRAQAKVIGYNGYGSLWRALV